MTRSLLARFALLVGYAAENDDTDADLWLVVKTRRPDWFR